MSIARRFLTGFRQTETNDPGLELNEDGTVDLVNPDGSRTALPGGSSSYLVATKHLTAAMILDIANTPIAVVPTPAANEIIYPIARLYRYKFGGQEYASDPGFFLAWESNLANTFATQVLTLLTQIEDAYDVASSLVANVGDADSQVGAVLGSALMVVAPTAAFAPPLGNGTLDVTIHYLKETLT